MILGPSQATRRYANNLALPSSHSPRISIAARKLAGPFRHAHMSVINRDQLVQAIQTSPKQVVQDLHKHQGEDIRLNSPNVQVSNLVACNTFSMAYVHIMQARPLSGSRVPCMTLMIKVMFQALMKARCLLMLWKSSTFTILWINLSHCK